MSSRLKRFLPKPAVRMLQDARQFYRERLEHPRVIRSVMSEAEAVRFEALYREAADIYKQNLAATGGESIALPLGTSGQVWVRKGSCDVLTYDDVFIRKQYGVVPVEGVKTIIDCGCNVGLAAAYFLTRFPGSRLIGLEPDPVNFELCKKNLAPFGDRVTILPAALWGNEGPLTIAPDTQGTWSSQVRPASGSDAGSANGGVSSGGSIPGLSMHTLLKQFGLATVDVLKIDIEGAEVDVFSAPDVSWLDRVRCVEIELHSDLCRSTFAKAIAGRGFLTQEVGQTTVAHRPSAAKGS